MKCPECGSERFCDQFRIQSYEGNLIELECLDCYEATEFHLLSPAELEAVDEMAKECVGFRRWASINCTGWSVIFARDEKYMKWKNSGPVVAAALEKIEDGEL